jgi:hypothetical protein
MLKIGIKGPFSDYRLSENEGFTFQLVDLQARGVTPETLRPKRGIKMGKS